MAGGLDQDENAKRAIEGGSSGDGTSPGPKDAPPDRKTPAPGPHADPSLTNPDATPGTGALPGDGQSGETDPGTA